MTSAAFSGLKCGTAYTLGVDAFDGAGKRSTVAELSAATSACAPPPPSGTGTVKQTIANGSTVSGVVNWRAVYDRNGDNVEDDPGSIDFLVDGTLVLTEEHMPFGDWTGHWTSTSVPNGQHTFLVRAKDAAGTVLASNTVTATVANGTPPTAGSVTQTIPNGARLSGTIDWRAVYDRNGDRVQDDPGSIRFLVDGNVVLSEESIPFGDWTGHWASRSVPNGSHTFEVRALDGAGTVVASNRVTATVENNAPAGDTTPPSSPGNTRVASATGNSVTVAWSAAADNVGVNGYGLYRSGNRTGETSQTTATFTGLSCGTAYQVGVDAYDAAGNRSTRSDVAATTAPCADTQPPTAPTNVTASNRTTTSITLTWAPATDNVGVAAYGIYNAGDLVHTTAGTTGIVSGLACGTNHTLAVDAFDGAGNSSSRTTVMVSTLPCADTAPPTQPSSLRATATTTSSITLAWNASTDNVAVVGYDVYRSTTKVGTTAGTTYTIAGLTCATTYPTGVRALDAAGNASTQANLNVTTAPCAAPPPPPPPPPSSGFPDAGNTGVRAGVTLTAYTGPTAITTPNTVIDGKTLGCVQIEAPGVVIRNSRLSCNPGGTAVVINRRTGSETWALIEDSEIDCRNGANSAGFGNSNLIIRRVEIQNCENGLNVQRNVTIEDSYVHNGYNEGESHMDGMQFTSAADNVRIVHNTILGVGNNGQLGTSSLIADLPGHSNWLIENNLFGGGAYTVYCVAGRGTNWIIRNNRFTLQYGRNGTSGAFGFATECSDETQSGNVVHETGQPITLG